MAVPVVYKGRQIKNPHVLDLVVDERLIVEVKSTEKYNAIYESQLLTYLRLTGLSLGLVVNFGERHVRNGIRRVVNHFQENNLCVLYVQPEAIMFHEVRTWQLECALGSQARRGAKGAMSLSH